VAYRFDSCCFFGCSLLLKSSREAPPRDPVCKFSLTNAFSRLYQHHKVDTEFKILPFFPILNGFKPGDVPGVGTFYDFINRLWKAEKKSATKIRKPLAPRRRRGKKNEKLPLARPGIVDRMVKRILQWDKHPLPARPEDVLNAIFQQVFVKPSAQKGMLGDASNYPQIGPLPSYLPHHRKATKTGIK